MLITIIVVLNSNLDKVGMAIGKPSPLVSRKCRCSCQKNPHRLPPQEGALSHLVLSADPVAVHLLSGGPGSSSGCLASIDAHSICSTAAAVRGRYNFELNS